MKSRLARIGIVVAEAAGVFAAVVFAFAGFIAWRVQAAPVDLTWAAPAFRAAANLAAADRLVQEIGGVRLAKAGDGGDYLLHLREVSITGPAGGTDADIPLVTLYFQPSALGAGKLGPTKILADGAKLRIVRRTDRKVTLDFGAPSNKKGNVFKALTGGAYFREAFESAALNDVSITFVDENSGRTWKGKSGNASIKRSATGYAAEAATEFEIGQHDASIAIAIDYAIEADVVKSKVSLISAPVGDLIAVFFNENAELFTSPVSGEAMIDFNTDGQVLASRINLNAGEGDLSIGGWSASISSFTADASFDPKLNRFLIERFGWKGGVGDGDLAGTVTLEPSSAAGDGVARVFFALESGVVNVDLPDFFESPWTIDRSAISGVYDVKEKTAAIDAVSADIHGLSLSGEGSFRAKKDGAAAFGARLKIAGVTDTQSVLRFWPRGLAASAREFVSGRMPAGMVGPAELDLNLETDDIGDDGAPPDDALTLTFRAEDATVIYAPGMTPLTRVAGTGVLKGNSFRFNADRGMAGPVRLTRGEVEIPTLAPKGKPAYFRLSAAGDAGEILAILDQAPLSVLKGSRFSASQYSGPVSAQVEIERPNLRIAPPESYRYNGVASFENLNIENIIADAPLTGAKGRLTLKTDGMTIAGEALFANAPVKIEWKQRFFGAGDKTALAVEGVANSSVADLLGIPTRQVLQGEAPFTATALGGVDAFRTLDIEADFTNAVLLSETFGWIKPAGAAAKGTAKFTFGKDGETVNAVSIKGDDLEISGVASLTKTGAVRSFDFPTFRLGRTTDLSATGARDESGALAVKIAGERFNAAEMVRQLTDDGVAGGSKAPFTLSARIARVDLRAGASYRDARLEFGRKDDHIETLHFSAAGEDGKPLSLELTPATDAGKGQSIAARTEDVGSMLAGIFGLTSVKGGAGRLDFAFTPGDKTAPRKGVLEAHNLRVVKAPLLAKIFAAGSLTGLADLMNGDGIELKNAMARFSIEDGELRIAVARATGPSVGITAQGEFDLDGDRAVTLSGAVAPAYGVNSLLGKTPVIGEIFVNRKGEGLLALSYDVSGPAAEPRVTVNPLSAFTPGVFRRMFEGRTADDEEAPPSATPVSDAPQPQAD